MFKYILCLFFGIQNKYNNYQQRRIWYEDVCCKRTVAVSVMKDLRHPAIYSGAAREQGRYGVALGSILV